MTVRKREYKMPTGINEKNGMLFAELAKSVVYEVTDHSGNIFASFDNASEAAAVCSYMNGGRKTKEAETALKKLDKKQ